MDKTTPAAIVIIGVKILVMFTQNLKKISMLELALNKVGNGNCCIIRIPHPGSFTNKKLVQHWLNSDKELIETYHLLADGIGCQN